MPLDETNQDLKYARWNGSLRDISVVDSAGNVGAYTSLTFDRAGYPAISYLDYTNGDLKFAHWNGTSWAIEAVDATSTMVGSYTSLTFDPVGYPAISYLDFTNGDLKFAHWSGNAWNLQTVDSSGNTGWQTSLAFDSSGDPAISYRENTNGYLKYACLVTRDTGTRLVPSFSLWGAVASALLFCIMIVWLLNRRPIHRDGLPPENLSS
ncbi:MAG: hypothetical protein NTU41_10685 [Chloroflexi bacterium]|nr:hypothetical protein [Chloroflexota bacterium]